MFLKIEKYFKFEIFSAEILTIKSIYEIIIRMFSATAFNLVCLFSFDLMKSDPICRRLSGYDVVFRVIFGIYNDVFKNGRCFLQNFLTIIAQVF